MAAVIERQEAPMLRKPLATCVNGDGRPVQAPSWVLCRVCLDRLSEKMHTLLSVFDTMEGPDAE